MTTLLDNLLLDIATQQQMISSETRPWRKKQLEKQFTKFMNKLADLNIKFKSNMI
jgi:hypothetical protein